jgi:alkylresorcinol/alkylpyrone synthase
MTTIATIATAVPPYRLTCAEVKQAVRQLFPIAPHRLAAVMQLFDHAQVAQRYSVLPLEELIRLRSLTERSWEYHEHAIALGRRVAADCLRQAGLRADAIDMLITVSCTGYMIPSLDAYLINDLGFRADIRRMPITELGCAGGAMALSRARIHPCLPWPQCARRRRRALQPDLPAARSLAGQLGRLCAVRRRRGRSAHY